MWREREDQEERLICQRRLFAEAQDIMAKTRIDLLTTIDLVGEGDAVTRAIRDTVYRADSLIRQFDDASAETLAAGHRRIRDLEDQYSSPQQHTADGNANQQR